MRFVSCTGHRLLRLSTENAFALHAGDYQCRVNNPRKRQSKTPRSKVPRSFFPQSGRAIGLMYFVCDIAFPSPTLKKADEEAVTRMTGRQKRQEFPDRLLAMLNPQD